MSGENKARGEVAVKVGAHDLILCVTPDNIARLSSMLGARTMHDLLSQVVGGAPHVVRDILHTLVQDGDGKAAWSDVKGPDYSAVSLAAADALTAHMVPDGTASKKP